MKKLLLLLTILLAGHKLAAQDTLALSNLEKQSFAVLKWSPFALLNIDPAIQVGAEFRTSQNQSIQAELGYGRFSFTDGNDEGYQSKETWRGRLEYRWYFRPYRKALRPEQAPRFPLGTYVAAELFYKQINIQEITSLGRDCVNEGCAYFEEVTHPVSRFINAGYIKIGWQSSLSSYPVSRILLDLNVGIGIRHMRVKRYRTAPLGEFEYRNGGGMFYRFDTPDSPSVPDMTIGFKIGYLLLKKQR